MESGYGQKSRLNEKIKRTVAEGYGAAPASSKTMSTLTNTQSLTAVLDLSIPHFSANNTRIQRSSLVHDCSVGPKPRQCLYSSSWNSSRHLEVQVYAYSRTVRNRHVAVDGFGYGTQHRGLVEFLPFVLI